MAKSTPETILLKGRQRRIERDAAAAITPGDILELTSSDTLQRHSTAEGVIVPRIIAVENDIAGDDLTDAYASGEVVQAHVCVAGDEVLANVANGQNVAIGAVLVSDGSGRLQAISAESAGVVQPSIFGIALEAKNLSGSSAVDPTFRTKVMVA